MKNRVCCQNMIWFGQGERRSREGRREREREREIEKNTSKCNRNVSISHTSRREGRRAASAALEGGGGGAISSGDAKPASRRMTAVCRNAKYIHPKIQELEQMRVKRVVAEKLGDQK